MQTTYVNKTNEQQRNVLPTIKPAYLNALATLTKKLAKEHINWAIGGKLGEALKKVPVEPDCIEIITSKKGAAGIFLAFKDLAPKGIYFQTQKLERNALIEGKEYPSYVRSYFFDFTIDMVEIKVHGDLQYRIGDWEWREKLAFNPEHVSVAGVKTAVVPLQTKYEIYKSLGWTDRAEKIQRILEFPKRAPRLA